MGSRQWTPFTHLRTTLYQARRLSWHSWATFFWTLLKSYCALAGAPKENILIACFSFLIRRKPNRHLSLNLLHIKKGLDLPISQRFRKKKWRHTQYAHLKSSWSKTNMGAKSIIIKILNMLNMYLFFSFFYHGILSSFFGCVFLKWCFLLVYSIYTILSHFCFLFLLVSFSLHCYQCSVSLV